MTPSSSATSRARRATLSAVPFSPTWRAAITWVAAAHSQVADGGSAGIRPSASLLWAYAADWLSTLSRFPASV